MDTSSLEALVYDPSKCRKLSMDQKRELIHEVAKLSENAHEMLQAWSRQEILQILCAELGKERKYTGLKKSKMIEHLLKIIDKKKSQKPATPNVSESQNPLRNGEITPQKPRKSDSQNQLAIVSYSAANIGSGSEIYCKNSACQAKMSAGDKFCKRCSCCICRQFDDNKDPSLWLVCNSDPPFLGVSCGVSFHLECALRHENSGISKDSQDKGLDGSFCCVSCGKVNDLLGSWRKQLIVARDTRRVDILCYRLSLSQKILDGTKHYQNLCIIVDEAVKKLEEDVGPLTGLPVKKARGIVNRLSSGPEIQRLCSSAVESLDLMLSNRVSGTSYDDNTLAAKLVRFEDIRASSVTVILDSDNSSSENISGYTLWHRKSDDIDYPVEPTCRMLGSKNEFLISGLTPDTRYFLKVVAFDADRELGFCEFQLRSGIYQEEVEIIQSPVTNCSSLSNPSSVEDETNNREDNYVPFCVKNGETSKNGKNLDGIFLLEAENSDDLNVGNKDLSKNGQILEETSTGNGSNTPSRTGLECVPYVDSSENLTITPLKSENIKSGSKRKTRPKRLNGSADLDLNFTRVDDPQAGSSSKKRNADEDSTGDDDKGFEYYVKVIRYLETEGYIETDFRRKFLTWYSFRATPQEVRVVKVFIDTFVEDPESLAGQLVDAFLDVVSNKRCSTVPAGFCMKLWH